MTPSEREVADLRRTLNGWLTWYRFATQDDECEYLNGKGWDDAEALASSTMGHLARSAVDQGKRECNSNGYHATPEASALVERYNKSEPSA